MVANGVASPPLLPGLASPPDKPDHKVWRAELSVQELEAMAMRQQEEMASQRALLAAKEQRLRALKHQQEGARCQEQDRLRRLRDRVQAQESKLTKLRALRGQLDHTKINNATLTCDLESIKALFSEKEKELTMAVAKVEELTRQLEEVRRGKGAQPQPPAHLNHELDRLRRELMYRNKLNEQQSQKLSEQREALSQRQQEMASIDKRIAELQERLHRKRMLNQQLANQINQAAKANQTNQSVCETQQCCRSPTAGSQPPKYNQSFNNIGKPTMRNVTSGNIAAVEPYHHIPSYENPSPVHDYLKPVDNMRPESQPGINNNTVEETLEVRKPNVPATHHYIHETSRKEEKHVDFAPSKTDPKYQTLPYNTKFQQKNLAKRGTGEGNENISEPIEPLKNINNMNNNYVNNQMNVAHSIPIQSGASKGLAMGPARFQPAASPSSNSSASSNGSFPPHPAYNQRMYGGLMVRGQPVGGTSSTTSSTSSLATTSSGSTNSHQVVNQQASRLTLPPTPLISDTQKPISAVPPTMHNSSSFFQTSSTKIHPVQPQKINSAPQVILKEESETNKPALPPKPAVPVKPTPPPPPRQTHNSIEVRSPIDPRSPLDVRQVIDGRIEQRPLLQVRTPVDVSSEAVDTALNVLRGTYNINRGMKEDEGRKVEQAIKPRPLTIRKQPPSDMPRLKNQPTEQVDQHEKRRNERLENDAYKRNNNEAEENTQQIGWSRRIEMPPAFLFPETPQLEDHDSPSSESHDETDRSAPTEDSDDSKENSEVVGRRAKKGNLKGTGEKQCLSRRVSFDPLALLLDAALEGELELVMRTASQVKDPSAANDEGITALHNAICAGHFDIVTFLVEFGCDVNAQDSDGWTPLHCAASCNNLAMVRFLVEHGACIFATTLSDHETAAEKCEEDEEGFDGCSEYLYSVQEKLGIMNNGVVYAVYDYEAHNSDELSFKEGGKLVILRKGDEWEREWWWARLDDKEGYIPRNLLGLYARVQANKSTEH